MNVQITAAGDLACKTLTANEEKQHTASNMFLREQAFTLVVECGFSVSFSTRPACQDEGDLVHEVGNVVGNIQGLGCTSGTVDLTEEVTCWVDCPTDAHNDAHVVIRLLDGCGHVAGSSCRRRLTSVTECKHQDSADQEFPEACWADGRLGSLQDEVELNHLQRDGDAPVDVPVHNRAPADGNPIFAHVHVVHCGNECDQASNMEGCLPMAMDGRRFGIKEDRGSNHCNGNDPEGHGREVCLAQERLLGLIHRER